VTGVQTCALPICYQTELADDYRAVAEKAATILDLDYCGVDLLIGEEGQPLVCEVNANAFITGIEKTTGINVAGSYCEHIFNEVYSDK
jgi:ribosomal protein S6--L-glutamate ligase/gamma-F420-2:alpha-L-glutamate ligase